MDVFRRAFESVEKTSFEECGFLIRLARCNGNFSTCDICNNGRTLENDPGREWAPGQLEIIKKYMDVHHKIQFAERQHQIASMIRARKLDAYGQPKELLMYFDGFSIHKGVTPKYGRGNFGGKSKTQKEDVSQSIKVIFIYD